MKLLYPEIKENKYTVRRKFDNAFFIFKDGDNLPFAYRAPSLADCLPERIESCETLFEFDRFKLSGTGKKICCQYHSKPSLNAYLSVLDTDKRFGKRDIESVVSYLSAAYNLDPRALPKASAITTCEELVSKVANFCGCLTDIFRDENIESRYGHLPESKQNGSFIAVSLPILALMYRRIAALRGFNFKVSFADSLPCLGFSAKVLLDNGDLNDIPEYSILCELADSDSLIIAAKLVKIAEEDGAVIRKLSVVICPQDIDPRGILRAPELIKRKESIIDKFDFDIPGKY